MKGNVIYILVLTIIFSFNFVVVAEEDSNTLKKPKSKVIVYETKQTNTVKANTEDLQMENPDDDAGITPDNYWYGLEKKLEDLQLLLTYSDKSKAELLLELANERIAEANMMAEKDKKDLLEATMRDYTEKITKTNKELVKIAEKDKGKEVIDISEKVAIVQNCGDHVLFEAEGKISEDVKQELQEKISVEIKKTITVKIFAMAKENLSKAEDLLKSAESEYKLALELGDSNLAEDKQTKLKEAKKYTQQMKEIKEEFEEANHELNQQSEIIYLYRYGPTGGLQLAFVCIIKKVYYDFIQKAGTIFDITANEEDGMIK